MKNPIHSYKNLVFRSVNNSENNKTMARKSIIARNEKRKRIVAKYAEKRAALKEAGDWEAIQKLPRNSSTTRVRNRCNATGRGRGVYSKFGLCRNVFRQLALEGKIPGVRKASW